MRTTLVILLLSVAALGSDSVINPMNVTRRVVRGRTVSTPLTGPRMKRVTITWECPRGFAEWATNWETGIEVIGSEGGWRVVMPYAVSNKITLENRPAMEMYRAFNRIKQ